MQDWRKSIDQLYNTYYAHKDTKATLQIQVLSEVTKICKHFNVPPPIVRVTQGRRGRYNYVKEMLVVTNCSGMTPVSTIVHETAHHITRRLYSPRRPHGKEFKRVLWQIIRFYYEMPTEYEWEREYRSVKKFLLRRIQKYIKKDLLPIKEADNG